MFVFFVYGIQFFFFNNHLGKKFIEFFTKFTINFFKNNKIIKFLAISLSKIKSNKFQDNCGNTNEKNDSVLSPSEIINNTNSLNTNQKIDTISLPLENMEKKFQYKKKVSNLIKNEVKQTIRIISIE